MGNRSKYRRLPDLFVVGKEVVFKDDSGEDVVMWLQVLNPWEVQEARNDAQGARGRVVMAVKDIGSREFDAIKGAFLRRSKDSAIQEILSAKYSEWFMQATNAIDSDPEWQERMEVIRTADQTQPASMSEEETALLAKLNVEYMAAINKHIEDESDYYKGHLERMTQEELLEEYTELWLDRRGNTVAITEYGISEIFYGARVCDAKPDEEGKFTKASHAECNGHKEKVFESREEVRVLPEEMFTVIREGFDDLAMSVRDAKNSARQGSSSDSSPLPSKEEESTPSTQEGVLTTVPGP